MRLLITALLGLICSAAALLLAGRVMARPVHGLALSATRNEQAASRQAPDLSATQLISIPYGFDSPLPLDVADQHIQTSGAGACTAGETATIAVTITQSTTGATANGEKVAACTGQQQTWWADAVVQGDAEMAVGSAEACGVATTRRDDTVTDSFEWCTEVRLNSFVYLPLVITTSP